MTQALDPVPFDQTKAILCCYVNASSKIQVVRITNVQNWYFERVVFPGQRLMFEAVIEGQLEIHSGSMASSILEDTIPCSRLVIDQSEDDMASIAVPSVLNLAENASSTLSEMQPVHS